MLVEASADVPRTVAAQRQVLLGMIKNAQRSRTANSFSENLDQVVSSILALQFPGEMQQDLLDEVALLAPAMEKKWRMQDFRLCATGWGLSRKMQDCFDQRPTSNPPK